MVKSSYVRFQLCHTLFEFVCFRLIMTNNDDKDEDYVDKDDVNDDNGNMLSFSTLLRIMSILRTILMTLLKILMMLKMR